MKKLFYITASLSCLIVASSIAYYLVWFLPSKEKVKNEVVQVQTSQEEKELQTRQDCREEARQKAKEKLEKLIQADLVSESEKQEYQKALDVGLAKQDDIDHYFDICLEVKGLK